MRKFVFSFLFLLALTLGFSACSITGEEPVLEELMEGKQGGGSGGGQAPIGPPD